MNLFSTPIDNPCDEKVVDVRVECRECGLWLDLPATGRVMASTDVMLVGVQVNDFREHIAEHERQQAEWKRTRW